MCVPSSLEAFLLLLLFHVNEKDRWEINTTTFRKKEMNRRRILGLLDSGDRNGREREEK